MLVVVERCFLREGVNKDVGVEYSLCLFVFLKLTSLRLYDPRQFDSFSSNHLSDIILSHLTHNLPGSPIFRINLLHFDPLYKGCLHFLFL